MARGIQYSKEFKLDVVKQVVAGQKPPIDVAKSIGVHVNTIYKWVQQYSEVGSNAFPGSGNPREDRLELIELRKKVRDLQETNEILKKAMAFFAKDR